VNTLDKEMIYVLGGMKLDRATFHHTTQKGAQFKTYKLFVSEIFYVRFSGHG
jgi:hypothetical protein